MPKTCKDFSPDYYECCIKCHTDEQDFDRSLMYIGKDWYVCCTIYQQINDTNV
jgi:hypothetical protein